MPVKEGEFEKSLDGLKARRAKGELGEMPNDPVRLPLFFPSFLRSLSFVSNRRNTSTTSAPSAPPVSPPL
jgi:hypothetical protein